MLEELDPTAENCARTRGLRLPPAARPVTCLGLSSLAFVFCARIGITRFEGFATFQKFDLRQCEEKYCEATLRSLFTTLSKRFSECHSKRSSKRFQTFSHDVVRDMLRICSAVIAYSQHRPRAIQMLPNCDPSPTE